MHHVKISLLVGIFFFGAVSDEWLYYTAADGLVGDDLTSICIDSSGCYRVSSWDGVNKFDRQKWTVYTTAEGLPTNLVNTIVADNKSNIWFCTEEGLCKYDGTKWTTHNFPGL
jgi:ligand-binding sensor domain-containing protein